VAVYSVMDSPVIIASMHRGTKFGSEYSAIDSAVSRAIAGGPNVALYVQWIVQL